MAIADVYLGDLGPGAIAGVGNIEMYFDVPGRGRRRNRQILVRKGGVGKSIAKRKQRLHSRFVIAAVSDEDALGVRNFLVCALWIVSVVRRDCPPIASRS